MQYKFHYIIFKILILVLFLLPFSAIAQEKGQTQEQSQNQTKVQPENNIAIVIGTAAIQNKNTAKAREKAIASGMILSVEQIALTVFSPDAISKHLLKFISVIQGHAQDYIENYEVLAESETKSKYFMMLRFTVSTELLKKNLSGFNEVIEQPQKEKDQGKTKILFLIAEQNLDNFSPEYWWGENKNPPPAFAETAMSDKMRAAGFSIIDHGNDPPDVDVAAAIIFQPDLDNREAVNIGKILNADIVVVGKAIVYKVMDTTYKEIPSFNATLTFRVINPKTGQEITSLLETAVKKNADSIQGSKDALRTAGTAAAEKLASQLIKITQAEKQDNGRMELIITGIKNLGNFVRFRKMLSNAEGVGEIQLHEMKSDQAVISIDFKQSPQKLAETLSLQQFELFNIKIDQVSEKRLNIELITK